MTVAARLTQAATSFALEAFGPNESNTSATAAAMVTGIGVGSNTVTSAPEVEGIGQLAFLRSGLEQLDAEIASLQQSLA